MRNERGKSIVTLVILTILIIIGAVVIINYAQQMMAENKVTGVTYINRCARRLYISEEY